MLQAMRERVTGILGWIVIGLIIMTFALFGLGSYLEDRSRAYAAKVNGQDISPGQLQQAVENQRARMQSMMGEAYNPSLISDDFLKSSAMDSLIQQEVIRQASENGKFKVSNQHLVNFLQSVPSLQEDGKFSQEKYQRLLFSRGLSAKAFEEDVRKSLQTSQYMKGFEDTSFITEQELLSAFRIQQQKRDFSYLQIAHLPFTETVSVSDEEVRAKYDENSANYMEPERVKVEYITLRKVDLESQIEIDQSELEEYYEERKESLIQQEQRRASHILIEAPASGDSADEDATKAKAQKVLDELNSGADFAELAKKHSSDPGSAENGGDLGFFGKGAMVPEFEEAAFSLSEGQVSDLVRSQFGYHIIKLTGIEASKMKDFEEARMDLEADMRSNKAGELYYEQFERLTDLSYDFPESLDAVKNELGLEIMQSEWINRSGGQGIGQYPALTAAIFSEDVLESGNNSTPIEVGDDEVIVARILDREPEKVKPFEAVEASINASLINEKAREQAKLKGEELLGQAQTGTELKSFEVADKITFAEVKDALRTVTGHSRDIVNAAFKQVPGTDNTSIHRGHELANGDYAIIKLDAVNEPDTSALTDVEKTQLRQGFERMFSQANTALLIDSLKQNAIVEIYSEDE